MRDLRVWPREKGTAQGGEVGLRILRSQQSSGTLWCLGVFILELYREYMPFLDNNWVRIIKIQIRNKKCKNIKHEMSNTRSAVLMFTFFVSSPSPIGVVGRPGAGKPSPNYSPPPLADGGGAEWRRERLDA